MSSIPVAIVDSDVIRAELMRDLLSRDARVKVCAVTRSLDDDEFASETDVQVIAIERSTYEMGRVSTSLREGSEQTVTKDVLIYEFPSITDQPDKQKPQLLVIEGALNLADSIVAVREARTS